MIMYTRRVCCFKVMLNMLKYLKYQRYWSCFSYCHTLGKTITLICSFNSENRSVRDVGFMAYPTSKINMTADETIIFDDGPRNEGRGYNATTGIFTAPEAGVYLLFFSILSEGGLESDIYLKINNEYYIYSYIAASQKYHTPCTSIFAELEKGDQVYLTAGGVGAIVDSTRFSWFGGQLITYLRI